MLTKSARRKAAMLRRFHEGGRDLSLAAWRRRMASRSRAMCGPNRKPIGSKSATTYRNMSKGII